MRSMLVALDGSAASEVATRMALQFIADKRANLAGPAPLLTGIAVIDRPTITKPQATPAGGGAFKRERDEALLAGAEETTQAILGDFQSACKESGVDHRTLRPEGQPYEAIAKAGHLHDMIVIGRDTNFHFQTSDDPCETFKLLVRDHPCPIVVTPRMAPEGSHVLIAYDGSSAASRALHAFALMNLNLTGLEVNIVSVGEDKNTIEENCSQASEYLRRHGVAARTHAVVSGGNITTVLMDLANQIGTRILVMGAYGNRGLRTVFFGSTTRELIERCPYPIFVY